MPNTLPAPGAIIPCGKWVQGYIAKQWYKVISPCEVVASPDGVDARRLISGIVKCQRDDEIREISPDLMLSIGAVADQAG